MKISAEVLSAATPYALNQPFGKFEHEKTASVRFFPPLT